MHDDELKEDGNAINVIERNRPLLLVDASMSIRSEMFK